MAENSPYFEAITAVRAQKLGNEEALADFGRAIELSPEYAWAIASRGQTYRAASPERVRDQPGSSGSHRSPGQRGVRAFS